MVSKQLRQRYGVSGAPLQVSAGVRTFVKDMEYNEEHNGIQTRSWIVIDGGQLHRSNTYDGNLGRGGNPTASYNTETVQNEKWLAKKVKGYTEVNASECPFIAVA